ncbi:hypothetical protein K466DRAFT_592879, partial [Polyporus arcularius HHB13444]
MDASSKHAGERGLWTEARTRYACVRAFPGRTQSAGTVRVVFVLFTASLSPAAPIPLPASRSSASSVPAPTSTRRLRRPQPVVEICRRSHP